MTVEQIAEIKNCLSPDVQIRAVLRDQVRVINSELAALTNTQINAMRFLRSQRRTILIGAAGTGKTVLAMARAQELARRGFRTLLVCFNRPLGERIKSDLAHQELITAGSFHSVCKELCERHAELPPGPINQMWWDEDLPAMFAEAVHDGDHKFDAIVVDEAQDFLNDWWSYLELAFNDTGNEIFCVFADSNQNIYQPGWVPPIDTDPFELDINCRNTVEIALRTNCLLSFEQETLGIHGLSPVFKEVSTDRQIEKALKASLMKLIDEEKLDPKQIVILVSRRDDVNRLRGTELEGFKLGDWQGSSVLVETIHRFKGLEADAVILILDDGAEVDLQRLAYVGMSRARAILHVIGSQRVQEVLKWPV
jgi:superfamily I DNA/RNA helicase